LENSLLTDEGRLGTAHLTTGLIDGTPGVCLRLGRHEICARHHQIVQMSARLIECDLRLHSRDATLAEFDFFTSDLLEGLEEVTGIDYLMPICD
jgi:hypothetical protein